MSSRILDALQSDRVLLMDGAMYTELARAGLRDGECGERWNLTNPAAVEAVHRAYVDAGAACLLTNTFQALPAAAAKHRFEVGEVFAAAIRLARAAAGRERFVLADLGPLATDFDAQIEAEAIRPHVGELDALLVETVTTATCLPTIETLRRRLPRLPLLLSLSFQRLPNGQVATLAGGEVEPFIQEALRLRPEALGVNCGRELDLHAVAEVLRRYRDMAGLPTFARPNAGTPVRLESGWSYPRSAERMGAELPELLNVGARLIGGCCGTTPETIAAFKIVVDRWNERRRG